MVAFAVPPGLLVGGTTTTLAATVSHGLWTVSVAIGAVSTLATVLGVIYGVRYRIAYEVERKAREGEQALNEALEDRIRAVAHERTEAREKLDEVTQALHDCERTISRLEALPNLERVLELMHSTFERIMDRVEELHKENREDIDQRSAESEERTGRIINEIRRAATA